MGLGALASGSDDFVWVLADFAVDVPAKAIPEDLTMHSTIDVKALDLRAAEAETGVDLLERQLDRIC